LTAETITGGGNGLRISYRDGNHTYKLSAATTDRFGPWLADLSQNDQDAALKAGVAIPSVTTALSVIDKSGPLKGWAANVTMDGVAAVLTEGKGRFPYPAAWVNPPHEDGSAERIEFQREKVKVALKRRGLAHWQVLKGAQDKGTAIHLVAQEWIEDGKVPILADYPEDQRGGITALGKFLREHKPKFLESEVLVGSARHGFAGRMDTIAILNLNGRRALADFKTGKAVRPDSMFPQLAAYAMASEECGVAPCDDHYIVLLKADGEPKLEKSPRPDLSREVFLRALDLYRAKRIHDAACK
jgi:hypothetical protein